MDLSPYLKTISYYTKSMFCIIQGSENYGKYNKNGSKAYF